LADTQTAHVEFAVPADVLSADGPFVVKDVPVLFRAGKYDFPEEDGGAFEMTADDIRAALEKVPPEGVPITNEHNKRCWFKGKLGRFVPAAPAGDYSEFGGKAKFPLPVVQLSGPGPYGLSANFRRADKTLQDVSLTWSPRIHDAAAFSAFAAFAKAEGSAMETTPHGRSRMQMIHDLAAEGGAICKGKPSDDVGMSEARFTSAAERDAMQAVHDTAAGMGANCNVYSDAPAKKLKAKREDLMASYSAEFGPPPDPRVAELEAQLAAIRSERAAEAEARKKAGEAHFAAQVASFAEEGRREAMQLFREGYVLPAALDTCIAAYVRAQTDKLKGAAEVRFTNHQGKEAVSADPVAEWRASWRSGEPHRFTKEELQARGAGEALFAANDNDPEAAETARLQKAMEERAERANGKTAKK
jgi:hypothetical protein